MRTVRLGWVQHDVLTAISRQTEEVVTSGAGSTLAKMIDLRGDAKKYDSRYRAAICAAVERHNAAQCGSDCPVDPTLTIISGSVGPRGGFGYYVK